MFGIDLDLGSIAVSKTLTLPLRRGASAFLGSRCWADPAPFAAPLVNDILEDVASPFINGSSDAIVRDHRRPAFQVPTTLGTSSDDLVQAFAGLEKQKEALIKDLSSDDPAKAFAAKLKLEALDKAQNFLISFDEQKQKTLQRCTQLT